MKWKFFIYFMIISEILSQNVIDIWTGEIPYDNGDTAQLTIFLPKKNIATRRAIILCPGGGYAGLSLQKEGTDWAPYFNEQGIAFFVLKYRLPKGNPLVPISDAEEAIKIIRRNANEYNIDPRQVGIMGASVGGHLASTIATHSEGDAKPDFHILLYPVITMDPSYTHLGSLKNFLGSVQNKELIEKYSNELHVSNQTSRVFIALCNNDDSVPPKNGFNYYLQCNLNGVSASFHVYPTGGHGFGFLSSFKYHLELLQELKTWLQSF